MKHWFHCSDLASTRVPLPEEEATHAVRVLRLRDGDEITLVDGKGTLARARLVIAGKHAVDAEILSRRTLERERRATIHLAVAPTKQMERFEWMLEKCTEIGVDRITPLATERTERSRLRHDRLEKIILGAMKQSQRAWLPRLDALMDINALISGTIPLARCFGWCEGEHASFTTVYNGAHDTLMVIGPEGDLTGSESDHLRQNGFQAVSLGEARLRTETAAVAACTWMNFAQHM